MITIGLQNKTMPLSGKVENYFFENENIGLKKTLFHKIIIPLEPFDSGLEYVEQPEKTEITFEWFNLSLSDPNDINGLDLNHKNYPDAEASIYIGSAHNWCNVKKLKFKKTKDNLYFVKGNILIDFESEGVANNELFSFETEVLFI